MPKILDLKKKPPNKNLVVEILGPVDVGKTPVAQLVARRIGATYISLPVIDPSTITGRGLLSALTTQARSLEAHPRWWAHIYAANLYEQQVRLNAALELGHVVITNYLIAFRVWMNCLGINISNFTIDLPEPNLAFLASTDQIIETMRPKFDFSPDLQRKIKRALTVYPENRVIRLDNEALKSNFQHVHMNNISVAITDYLSSYHGVVVDPRHLYTASSFVRKKDR